MYCLAVTNLFSYPTAHLAMAASFTLLQKYFQGGPQSKISGYIASRSQHASEGQFCDIKLRFHENR